VTIAEESGNVFTDTYYRVGGRAMASYVSDTMSFLDARLTVTPGLHYEDVDMDFRDNLSGNTEENSAAGLLPVRPGIPGRPAG
jgi:Fe(3+) dicitrate transport protein